MKQSILFVLFVLLTVGCRTDLSLSEEEHFARTLEKTIHDSSYVVFLLDTVLIDQNTSELVYFEQYGIYDGDDTKLYEISIDFQANRPVGKFKKSGSPTTHELSEEKTLYYQYKLGRYSK